MNALILACAVCGGGGANQQAFIDTMVLLSALPLLMLAGAAYVVWTYNRPEQRPAPKLLLRERPTEPQQTS
jgi:hypothetical protein